MKIRIGSRKSDLARIQAYSVGKALESLSEVESVEYIFKSSLGDQNQDDPLWQMPEKGVFTQDLTKDLISEDVDLVVHSWKDLPVEEREQTFIAGTLPREDQRDLLIFRKDRLENLTSTRIAKIFSSSPRRAHNLGKFLAWALPGGKNKIEFENVRGNIQTRVRKLLEAESVDGLIVAKAALDRMLSATQDEFKDSLDLLKSALEKCHIMVLPLKENPTAAAQGAVAIEIRRSDSALVKLIEAINCKETFENARCERKVLKSHGGGCHQKIGVSSLSRHYGQLLSLRGESEAGEELDQWSLGREKQFDAQIHEAFPAEMGKARLYDDESLNFDNSKLESADALYISKWRALPDSIQIEPNQVVWTAGLRTWRKLAARGIWVTGSSESLGEHEKPRLEQLKGSLKWLKLTHEAAIAYSNENETPALATYKLTSPNVPKDLAQKEYFFWTSFSSCKAALEAYPEIRDRNHSCGPGNTAKLIEQELNIKPIVFASYKEWLSEFQ